MISIPRVTKLHMHGAIATSKSNLRNAWNFCIKHYRTWNIVAGVSAFQYGQRGKRATFFFEFILADHYYSKAAIRADTAAGSAI